MDMIEFGTVGTLNLNILDNNSKAIDALDEKQTKSNINKIKIRY